MLKASLRGTQEQGKMQSGNSTKVQASAGCNLPLHRAALLPTHRPDKYSHTRAFRLITEQDDIENEKLRIKQCKLQGVN